MSKLVFNEQGMAFAELLDNPITRDEITECFENCEAQKVDVLSLHNGRTRSGRFLQIYYRYNVKTDEFMIFNARENFSGRRRIN